jgi:pimeloyl-ACP methyl ester carboxylesterase
VGHHTRTQNRTLCFVKRWWKLIVFGVFFVMAAAAMWGFVQILSLQPPVQEANINTRRAARVYKESTVFAPMSAYKQSNGLFSAAGASRVLIMLPDLGTGAWSFAPWMQELRGVERHAVAYRNMLGAKPVLNANLADYEADARAAIEAARRGRKVVLLGQGIGAFFALKIASERPAWLEGLVLAAPYTPRPWSGVQLGVAQFVGQQIYNGVYSNAAASQDFWRKNFGNGFIQLGLRDLFLEQYALARQPFEFRDALMQSLFDPMPQLPSWYASLEQAKFPVLHMIARFDTSNPIGGQRILREELTKTLGSRYSVAILNSGKYISMDWRWREAAGVLTDFLTDLKLKQNFIENEVALDPLTIVADK